MSSILTNNSAMVALQTLKSINNDLSKTTQMISTGKEVGSAKDNASVWAISKVMESDVKGFKGISDSLSRGESTVAVARSAAETITNLLTEIKGKVVAGQEGNAAEKAKIQADITALTGQITSIVGAAQFNGVNLVDGGANMAVLSSLDRAADGSVTSKSITVLNQNLSTGGYTAKAAFTAGTNSVATAALDGFTSVLAGDGTGSTFDVVIADPTYAAGDSISITIGDQTVTETITAAQVSSTSTSDLIAASLKSKVDALGITGLTVDYNVANAGQLVFTTDATAVADLTVTGQFSNATAGGLGALAGIDVAGNPAGSLTSIETMINTSINAAAALGSSQGRIELQSDFISNLTDSLKSGIGAMVDADMEEASARLQALQVQQQLGTQSLSIANQAPQSILSLFR